MSAAGYPHLAGQSRSLRLKKIAQFEQLSLILRRRRKIRTGLNKQPYVASATNHVATANSPNGDAMAMKSRQQRFTGRTDNYVSAALITNVHLALLVVREVRSWQSVCRAHRHHRRVSGAQSVWLWADADETASIRSLDIVVNPKQKRTLCRVAFRQ